ncbi:MAG: cation-translocating P-type ATPase [Chryseosolibacter sp.]
MPVSTAPPLTGLSDAQVLEARARHGRNEVAAGKSTFLLLVKDIFKEPMVLLLLAAALIYFVSGETGDAVFMTIGIVLVTGISLFQESRSRKALAALRALTAPVCKVIRNGKTQSIKREEIVVGDYVVVEEGTAVPADGIIIQSNDFSVDESILTGESLSVIKNSMENGRVFQGTTVASGLAICRVVAIGAKTELGKIGISIESIGEEETPLQKQIRNFVKKMALAGVLVFLIVWAINFYQSHALLPSLLQALTLAMSILPEEIPVAFTTFMALGAWRLMKVGIIARHIKTVETLGSASVICTDKTGTITENRMTLAGVFVLPSGAISGPGHFGPGEHALIRMAMWASEPIPFDPMEAALHQAYAAAATVDERPYYKMIREYPLAGRPPMMTHIFANEGGDTIIAAKGAPEALMKVSDLTDPDREAVTRALADLYGQGFRVLAVGVSTFYGDDYPPSQDQLPFRMLGLVAFYDPPKKNIREVFESFYNAGINVKIITGDNAATTATIARQIHFRGSEKTMTGEELLKLDEREVREKVMEINIFSRMFPDAKLRILNALKANGQIVAMTGDGVNDGPALKASHIGIAMGKKGAELAKQVSSLILADDDLAKMVDAVAMGRKIYANLKKAIQYIISIHIPIILTVFLPLVLGWVYPAIFSPVHVIFLELIMGPTCSIIYENEPMEAGLMHQKPRPFTTTFFKIQELSTSIVQGLVITVGTLSVYQFAVAHGYDEPVTRTMVFITLISANIFLTLVNRSFYFSILTTIRYRNNLVPLMIAITVGLTAMLLWVPLLRNLFQFGNISTYQLLVAVTAGCVSVLWFEVVKIVRRTAKK